jgi:hypothetical protein
MPPATDLRRWLLSFPSYGYLLTAEPDHAEAVAVAFADRGIECRDIGVITHGNLLEFAWGEGFREVFTEVSASPALAAVAL